MFKYRFRKVVRILGIVYIILLTLFFILGNTISAFDGMFEIRDGINFILQIAATLGMFAYLFRKKLFNRDFWKVIFVMIILWDIFSCFIYDTVLSPREFSVDSVIANYILQLPIYLSLYFYSFGPQNIFSGNFAADEVVDEVKGNNSMVSGTTYTLKIGEYMRDSGIIEKRSNAGKISVMSIVSISLLPLGIIWYIASFAIDAAELISPENTPYLMLGTLLILLASFVLGIIDLCKKNRRKILSIISVSLSSLPLLIFLLLVIVMSAFK